MTERFVTNLDADTCTAMAALLGKRLVDTIDLTLAVKEALWNLKGTGFIGVHELLDVVADRLRAHADLLAERIVILGGTARGTLHFAAGSTSL